MIPCDRAGNFRVSVIDYGLVEEKSGSVAISLQFKLLQIWNGQEWDGWEEYNMSAEGRIYVIKKDGGINQGAAESLMKWAGWDGLFDSVANHTWDPTPFSCTIEENVYENKTSFRIGFINDWNRSPGALGNVDPAKAKELQTKYGAQFRALAATVKRNGAAPPSGGPTPPPKPPALAPSPPGAGSEKDIPF